MSQYQSNSLQKTMDETSSLIASKNNTQAPEKRKRESYQGDKAPKPRATKNVSKKEGAGVPKKESGAQKTQTTAKSRLNEIKEPRVRDAKGRFVSTKKAPQ